ncbi:protein-disulfide reductase DsbD family protein [Runella salmonicolor]|uniref:Thioredoxin family protein n=1 Tax=Runella salmonicolor TaxID=2950278 RepID=A0ABT1FN98_9BACT|nr:thioredoxin family protein [Runella salmonicolor]MCP1383226.1 thioredoxin family protein [Runella salmonicolor]
MKRIAAILLLLLVSVSTFSQVKNHATWTFEVPKKEVKVGEVIEIKFNAIIDEGWDLYSSEFPAEDPIKTTFEYKKNGTFELVGKVKPIGFHNKEDEFFGTVSIAEGKASFVQKIRILKENPVIEGVIDGQTCTVKDGQCVLLKSDFKFPSIKVTAASTAEASKTDVVAPTAEPQVTENVQPTTTPKADTTQAEATASAENTISDVPVSEPEESLWSFLLACFLGGLASIFMPCIYPIMPMTVSYFTKQEHGTGKALVYGLSIVAIFTLLGFLVSRVGGAQAANFISTHWAPNAIFFVVFILFGLSFLGLFEIVLPNSFVNSVDKQADKGGLIGIFFMALTLVVVSFSCTAPIAGSLLILASKGNEVMRPVLGMIFFSLPFAVVFTGLAMFPKFLKSLPKSGGWLNEFKVVFGLLEFALALKFLSNIDLAYQWQVLDREVFLAIWIVLFSIIGFYVLGKLRMDKDSPVKGITIPRLLISSATFAFVVYMIPGMFGAPLRALSGWLPPEQTQDFYLTNAVGGGTSAPALTASGRRKPHLPHGLEGYFDYEQALAEAKAQGKPVFIDFTGFNCANCRKMEANVWPQPEVLERLKKNFVIASLYVDDKTELPKEKQFVSTYDQREKTTIGDKNADLQITKFNNNAQPFYCLVTPEGELLTKPVGYTSAEEFTRFLDEGLTKYKK